MKLSMLLWALLMLAGEGITIAVAASNPLVQPHMGLTLLISFSGFVGTAMFFGRLGQEDTKIQIRVGGKNNVQRMD